jgi:hypothetical protein
VNNFQQIIRNWFGDGVGKNKPDQFVILFQKLQQAGMTHKDLPDVGDELLLLLNKELISDILSVTYSKILYEKIRYFYRSVVKKTNAVVPNQIEEGTLDLTSDTDYGDIYPNNTSEPDIDLRGIVFEETPIDKEFLRKLGVLDE